MTLKLDLVVLHSKYKLIFDIHLDCKMYQAGVFPSFKDAKRRQGKASN